MRPQAIDDATDPHASIRACRLAPVTKLALLAWSVTLLLNGTFIRRRPPGSFAAADWLIIMRLVVALLGMGLGMYLISKRSLRLGTGGKLIIAYILIGLVSSLCSDYIRPSIGYLALLAGAGLLTVGLTSQQTSMAGLSRLETLFFALLSFCVLKDAALSLLAPGLGGTLDGIATPVRMGRGIVPPNRLSMMAAIAFWIPLKFSGDRKMVLVWLLRILLLIVVIMTRSRVSLIALATGGMVWYWLKHRASNIKGVSARVGMLFLVLASFLTLILLLVSGFEPLLSLLNLVNRGEDLGKIMSLTGRTDVWAIVLKQLAAEPITAVVGHGYGTSILLMGELSDSLYFIPRHTHNTLFEFLLTMGFPGVLLCISIFVYGFRWVRIFGESRVGSTEYLLARNGIIVLTMILLNCMTEVYIAEKVNFVLMALFMYLAILGQTEILKKAETVSDTPIG